MQKKTRVSKKREAIGDLRISLEDGTAHLSSMMQSYKVRLRGLAYNNIDGTSRRDIIATCKNGEDIELVRESENSKDNNAVAVYCRGKQIGYVPAGDRRLAVHMDAGLEVFAHIVAIDGGPTFVDRLCWWRRPANYRCVIQIDKGYRKIPDRDEG